MLWTALGMGLMWYASGTLMPEIDTMIGGVDESNPVAQQVFGADPAALSDSFLGIMILYAALCCAAYAIVMAGRAKAEESSGRAELALALPVSRTRWFGRPAPRGGRERRAAGGERLRDVGRRRLGGLGLPVFADYTTVIVTYAPALAVYLGLTAALFAWVPACCRAGLGTSGVHVRDRHVRWYARSARVGASSLTLRLGSHPFVEDAQTAEMLGLWGIVGGLLAAAIAGFRRRDVAS